jgi:hypothetical protein
MHSNISRLSHGLKLSISELVYIEVALHLFVKYNDQEFRDIELIQFGAIFCF